MILPLATMQLNELTEAQRAIRDHFQKGGSFLPILAVVLVIALILVVTYLLSQRIAKHDKSARRNDPLKLFHDLLARVDMAPGQKRILERIGHDLDIEHPAVILLCRQLFDRHAREWQNRERGRSHRRKNDDRILASVRKHLFPGS